MTGAAIIHRVNARFTGRARRILLGALSVVLALVLLDRIFPPPLERAQHLSVMVTDRTGTPLRAFSTKEGRWRFQARLGRIDPLFLDALLRVEDKRFYTHSGVDFIAMVRASLTSLAAGRIVSGGSTITMQTARLLEPRERTIPSKLIEMVRAFQIERRLSKQEILELYLTLAPYGGNFEGVRAASLGWFGHEPAHLTDDQIALLIALPQSPEVRRPDRKPEQARLSRARIAKKLEGLGVLSTNRVSEVNQAALPKRQAFPNKAWHAAAQARRLSQKPDIVSTLDAQLQADLEALLAERASQLGSDVQIAAMVVDIPSRAVRASIGSVSRKRSGGWLDLTKQARSPGSTLKPFIYALTFDDGAASPETIINDLPTRFAAYQPDNFDRNFRGDVTISQALQHSLNVPAVMALERVGPARFAAQLRLAGADLKIYGQADKDPGLALALGGAGITLQDLTALYASLGDNGIAKPLVWFANEEASAKASKGKRFLSANSAHDILTILADAPSPTGRAPSKLVQNAPQIAFKTGTSYGFRDAWAAGVAGDKAFVVWVGRPDGTPRPGHVGRSDALPILFDIADRTAVHLGVDARETDRLFKEDHVTPKTTLATFDSDEAPPQILFPPVGAELWAGQADGAPARAFILAGRGAGQLNWYIDGTPCPIDDGGLPAWSPEQAGFYMVSVVDSAGRSTKRRVRVLQ